MTIPSRPLGVIKDLIESIGLDITYAYEDLIFIEHNAFLLQMAQEGTDLGIWFNTESNVEDRPNILAQLQQSGGTLGLDIDVKGTYTMEPQNEEESFRIVFN